MTPNYADPSTPTTYVLELRNNTSWDGSQNWLDSCKTEVESFSYYPDVTVNDYDAAFSIDYGNFGFVSKEEYPTPAYPNKLVDISETLGLTRDAVLRAQYGNGAFRLYIYMNNATFSGTEPFLGGYNSASVKYIERNVTQSHLSEVMRDIFRRSTRSPIQVHELLFEAKCC